MDITRIQLTKGRDIIRWKFGCNDKFSVKSVYNAMTSNDVVQYHKKFWKGKVREKIKIFLWMILNNAILSKDNMIRTNWSGSSSNANLCRK
jgi:hypothetical protein